MMYISSVSGLTAVAMAFTWGLIRSRTVANDRCIMVCGYSGLPNALVGNPQETPDDMLGFGLLPII
jgi:hypothetical protein